MEHVLLLDMAIHTFDALRYISGADAEAVYCREWNPAGSWYDHDASAVAIFEMSRGVMATYRGSWCSEGLATTWESDWRLIGTRGSARWDGGDGFQAEVVPDDAAPAFRRAVVPAALPELDTTGYESGHDSCIRNFVDAVRHGVVPETPASDNIRSLAMVFGAIESAEAGGRVIVDSDSR
jgi:predicted dehydrogenase